MARAPSGRGRRADYQWLGFATAFAANTLSGTQAFAGSLGVGGTVGSGTIVRVRGHVAVAMDVGAADDSGVVGIGLILGSADAVSVGSTAFPSPLDDTAANWLWHGLFALRSLTATQEANAGGQYVDREIDSKAMRKFKANQSLVVMADAAQLSGSPTFDVIGSIRVLMAS